VTFASKPRLASRQRRIFRTGTSLGFLGLMIASGCTDEVGGDGYEPPRPTAGNQADGGVNAGGMDDDGGAPFQPGAGKGGSSSTAGKASGGKASGGKASGGKGGGTVTEGGGGAGETTGPVCGNMAVEEGEQCDDGNTKSGDGCTADCKSDCEVCEKTFCKAVSSGEAGVFNAAGVVPLSDPFTACFENDALAKAGPAQGVKLSDLCQAAVDCVRHEQCAQLTPPNAPSSAATGYGFLHCFCSADVTVPAYKTTCDKPESYDPKIDPNYIGKCKREFQEASEYDDEAPVIGAAQRLNKALGYANLLLLTCDRSLCTEECLPQITTGVVGQIAADIVVANNEAGESPFGDLMADSQRAATGTDFAFVRSSVFQSEYAPTALFVHAAPGRPADAEGRVLHSELRQVIFGYYPGTSVTNETAVGRSLVTVKATGQQIYDLLEAASSDTPSGKFLQVSGLTFKWRRAQPRIEEVRKNGTLLDKSATYTVTVDNFFSTPVPGATDLVTTDKTPESALVSYLKSLPQPISPPALDRITLSN
jgi:cysteine-rich repeat protein